ncbi:hypothetical protein ACT4MK_32055 [Bradyrhizobium barranii]|uniref:hypothetical protein n=1 Tax=Bradyrhizobium TaxID=374 RepID=UPI0007C1CFB0|nr:hypothetical protein [Bradyrhizobium sp.]CUU15692.1 hypothetical protein CDS [Bradyrhizobium sp.]
MSDKRAELERLSEDDPVLARLLRQEYPTSDGYIDAQWGRHGGPTTDLDEQAREQRIIDLLDALERQDAEARREGDELEELIRDVLYRLNDVREGSAEYRMIVRQLKGLRECSELGRLIFEGFAMGCRPWVPAEVYGWEPD